MRSSQIICELARESNIDEERAYYQLHRRNSRSLAPLLMALIAFPIGVLFRRAGRMVAFAVSFIPLALYFGSGILSIQLASTTHEPLLAWTPAVVLALATVFMLGKVLRK